MPTDSDCRAASKKKVERPRETAISFPFGPLPNLFECTFNAKRRRQIEGIRWPNCVESHGRLRRILSETGGLSFVYRLRTQAACQRRGGQQLEQTSPDLGDRSFTERSIS